MADDLDQLLTARAVANQEDDLDRLLTARADSETTPSASRFREPSKKDLAEFKAWNQPAQDMPWYKRAATGLADPLIGAGQLVQNIVPDAAMNVARKAGGSLLSAVGADELGADIAKPVSTDEFNAGVRRREQGYQADRGGDTSLDLARVAGNVANPVSWLAPEGTGAGILAATAAGAKQGAFQALLQPVTDSGSFLYDKGLQAAVGGAVGGTLGGALEALRPVFRYAKTSLGKAFGSADDAAQQAGAAKITEDTLKAAGVDPAKVDPNLYSAIKQEVGDALKAGVDPDPKVMMNVADAASLPVPIQLTRGQASRDAMQYSWEVNSSKIKGAGEQLNDRLVNQNRQLIENLNVLGAKDAPSTFDASQKLIQHLEGMDAQAKAAVDAAYSKVRDSAGRPALMDQQAFQTAAREGLEQGQLTEFVPEAIKKQYNALALGQLPLTVDTAQTLDRVWSAEQRAAQGSAKMAIGKLRDALNNAPVSDALGTESMQAYQAARQLARQRFEMMDTNPAYKAVVDGVEPDKFFQKYVQAANVSELAGLKQLVGPDNTAMLQQTLIGNLKKAALNRASDDNGVFSQAAYNKVLQDPVQGPRIQELFKDNPEALGALYRLGRVAENIVAFPKGHGVNTSNTAPTAANIIRDVAKSEAGASLANMIPGVRPVREVNAQRAAAKAVDEALNPGVTAAPLKKVPPSAQTRKLSDLVSRVGATVASSDRDE